MYINKIYLLKCQIYYNSNEGIYYFWRLGFKVNIKELYFYVILFKFKCLVCVKVPIDLYDLSNVT